MLWFYDVYDAISAFMDKGGIVLWFIAALLLAVWSLILERVWYFMGAHRSLKKQVISDWNARDDHKSWAAHRIREAIISQVSLSIEDNLLLIKTLVSLAPLLGLLGTVTGMITVFDVLAITGGGDAREMASGVSKATIPTMAGMVAALSGVFASSWLVRTAEREKALIKDQLVIEH